MALSPHALVVDDDPVVAKLCSRVLVGLGFSVTATGTAAQARAAADVQEVSLAICDVSLPDGNGLDILAWLRETGRPPAAVVITGEPTGEVRARAASLGVRRVLAKPFLIEDLQEAVLDAAPGHEH